MGTEREQEFKKTRETIAMEYEYTIGTLWNNRPKGFIHKIDGLCRGTAKGYADADWWRASEDEGSIRDIDIGFLLGMQAAAHQIAFLSHRVSKLEEQIRK